MYTEYICTYGSVDHIVPYTELYTEIDYFRIMGLQDLSMGSRAGSIRTLKLGYTGKLFSHLTHNGYTLDGGGGGQLQRQSVTPNSMTPQGGEEGWRYKCKENRKKDSHLTNIPSTADVGPYATVSFMSWVLMWVFIA